MQPVIKISCIYRNRYYRNIQALIDSFTEKELYVIHRQQVHLYNQSIATALQTTNKQVSLEKVDPGAKVDAYISEMKPPQVHKLPFNMQQELSYFDISYMNDPSSAKMKRAG